MTYESACEAIVHLGLTVFENEGMGNPTAEQLASFLYEAEERVVGAPIQISDVRCGLLRLRTSGQALAIVGGEETRYVLRSAPEARAHG